MDTNNVFFVVLVFLLSIIPSSLTITHLIPHPIRGILKTGFIELFAGYGCYFLVSKGKFLNIKIITFSAIAIINIFVLLTFKYPYYFEYFFVTSHGFKEIVNHVSQTEDDFEKIYITKNTNQAFIYFLFYKKYPPEKFLGAVVKRNYDPTPFPLERVTSFDKYEFCDIKDCYNDTQRAIYVIREDELIYTKVKNYIKPNQDSDLIIIEQY